MNKEQKNILLKLIIDGIFEYYKKKKSSKEFMYVMAFCAEDIETYKQSLIDELIKMDNGIYKALDKCISQSGNDCSQNILEIWETLQKEISFEKGFKKKQEKNSKKGIFLRKFRKKEDE